jgi:hypothetical protein
MVWVYHSVCLVHLTMLAPLHKTKWKTTKPNHAPKFGSTKVAIKVRGWGCSRLPMEVIKVAQYKAPHWRTKFQQTQPQKPLAFFALLKFHESHKVTSKGPLHTHDWKPVTITLQALSLLANAERVQVRFTLRLRDQWSMWMQDGCEVYVDSYMALNRACFMLTWTIFQNHLLDVGLTQNRQTIALRTLTTVDIFYYIMCENPHE